MPAPIRIKQTLSCPHCWQEFPIDQILFIAESQNLYGDPKLGDQYAKRFLPLRFDEHGAAYDTDGVLCDNIACPNCHLQIPRQLLHLPDFFVSIAGAPASGKSYFLASMIWQLRKTMASKFCIDFTDADPALNRRIREYETAQFMGSDDPDKPVAIEKTDVQGDIYNNTIINNTPTTLAQPFSYTIQPMPSHPFIKSVSNASQVVCVYDNAGESFLPGADVTSQPVTRHLARSDALLFVFDPTQDVRFRSACKQPVDDPQMQPSKGVDVRKSSVAQETVLTNVVTHIKKLTHIAPQDKLKIPLIIVLTKYDAWQQLLPIPKDAAGNPKPLWKTTDKPPLHAYNDARVSDYSKTLRTLLLELIPSLVSTAEVAAEKVAYIAISATGCAPEIGEPDQNGVRPLVYRPKNINPIWAEVPFLHALALTGRNCTLLLSHFKK
ncbi:hypothetical protein FACS189454_00780 [Planctomycetales bacterium]|nr:hypothetical protein FACS189454_00780 [Planctomycetales bacterium]